jgi:hypothetical protein
MVRKIKHQPSGLRVKPSGLRGFPSGPSFVSRRFELLQLAFVRTIQHPAGWLSVFDQALGFLSKTQIWEDCCNRPDDVESRPDELIHKASITIQIQMSGRQSAWSGRASIRYGNCVHQISLPDDHPLDPDARSLYMEITCSERATVRTTGQHRSDAALKQERFSAKFSKFQSHSCPSGRPMTTDWMTPSFIKLDTHLNCQPLNRGS